ncbi:phosphoribosylaminoimidazolesuccinocarboxamide synthase [Candidatus Omnitrophota bacterium]
MIKGTLKYEGKAKKVFATDDTNLLIQEFKDDATAFDATKRGTILEKGICNNKISAHIFELLDSRGIPTHFIKVLSEREMLVKKLEIVPVEVTVRNVVAGGMAKMFGLDEGIVLRRPVLEYHYKNDELHDPLINESHIFALDLAEEKEIRVIAKYTMEINHILIKFFDRHDLKLVDFKLEFGRHKGKILLGDEISPDTCRLWDKDTNKKLDKDRFRRDLGQIEDAYQEVLRRLLN